MSIVVFGATCQVGRFLLPALARSGERVVAISRHADERSADGIVWRRGRLPDAMPALDGIEAVVSFAPLRALAQWLATDARGQPIARLVATSSMSAVSKRESPVAAERAIAAALATGEDEVLTECRRRGIRATLLRPTLIYGAGIDRSLSPIARLATRTGVFPQLRGPGLRQPVHAEDVALAVQAALRGGPGPERLEIGGGERLTVTELFARVRASLPRAVVPVPVPFLASRALAHVPGLPKGPLRRLGQDLVADNAALVQALGIHPRPFRPTAATWGLDR